MQYVSCYVAEIFFLSQKLNSLQKQNATHKVGAKATYYSEQQI